MIEVSREDGTGRFVVVPSGVESPHSLALDPARGLLFWTDLGKQPCIRRAGLDGSNIMTVVALVSGSVTDISLDFEVYTVKLTTNLAGCFLENLFVLSKCYQFIYSKM